MRIKNEDAWEMIETHSLVESCTKKDAFWHHLEALQQRGHMSQHDILNLHGMLTALTHQPEEE